MPTVFIHGVADTYRVWNDVRSRLDDVGVVALALPGFGTAVPEGFEADKESYVDWIIGQIEKFAAPVNLVGHDWGCMFALRVASLRPDLVRTVVAGNGPISQDYEWHHLARIWQTPGEGEKFMRELDEESFSVVLQSLEVSAASAATIAQHVDDRMKDSILRLYRSAVHVGHDWQPDLSRIQCPTTIYWGRRDTECPVRFAHQMAESVANSQVVEFDCGHWVPLQMPKELAALIDAADVS